MYVWLYAVSFHRICVQDVGDLFIRKRKPFADLRVDVHAQRPCGILCYPGLKNAELLRVKFGVLGKIIEVISKKFLKLILSNKRKFHNILNKRNNTFDPANKERRT